VCGINLFVDKRNNPDETIIRRMNISIRHRGPDASRFGRYTFANNAIFIGNNRLKIIDKSDEANQPFISSDGRFCLSFNGEIYNYRELRKSLDKKYSFRTGSDSEVLLYHLIEHGAEGLSELNGMFAFILYDSQTGTVLVARDRHGIKPLYYSSHEHYLLISSEIKGILSAGLVKKELNSAQIPHYLKYKYAKRPETFYKNIFELEPGHLIYADQHTLEISKWVKPANDKKINPESSLLIKNTKELLFKAVERQLESDVSNGIFLSGGVDSTLLLAIVNELGITDFPSFSIVNTPEDKDFGTDDYIYARKAARLYNSVHHEISIDSSILKKSEELFQQMDQPIGDSALLLTWLISDFSAKKVKVAMSGAGADEWFAGYNRHWAYKKYLDYFYKHDTLIHFSGLLVNIIPEGFSHPFRKQAKLWNKFASEMNPDPLLTFDNFSGLQYPTDLIKSGKQKVNTGLPRETLLQNALQKDRNGYLISDILMLTDKMSMLKSLEVRVPYLDNELTSFIEQLPSELLLKNGKKWILKEILQDLQGKDFTQRKKEGFGMPVGKWIKKEENHFLLEHLKNKNSLLYHYIPFEKTAEMLSEHLSGKKDHSAILWSLIVLANWIQKEFS
jgi:asparagine synthase (glutamine-hydrolysing)